MAFQDSPNLDRYDEGIPKKQPGKFNRSVGKKFILWFTVSTIVILSLIILGKNDTFQGVVGEGAIEGKVVDDGGAEFSAEIVLAGTNLSVVADTNGNFVIENIPQGAYSIIFLNENYGWEEKIIVESGKTVDMGVVEIPYIEFEESNLEE